MDYVPGSNPTLVSPQQSNLGLILEGVDPYVPSPLLYGPIFVKVRHCGEYGIENDEVKYVPRSPSSPSISNVQAQAPNSPHQQPNEGLIHEDVGRSYISTLPSFIPFM